MPKLAPKTHWEGDVKGKIFNFGSDFLEIGSGGSGRCRSHSSSSSNIFCSSSNKFSKTRTDMA